MTTGERHNVQRLSEKSTSLLGSFFKTVELLPAHTHSLQPRVVATDLLFNSQEMCLIIKKKKGGGGGKTLADTLSGKLCSLSSQYKPVFKAGNLAN